ncbi:Threonine/homoserine efflux transporter RhtA [Devosia sp. YR412]|uniref:DMT family transporter n=1 Tax=Devosia sp. YR412 TaxID=1881030 RepID=UPI0008C477BB|nr:DMT family transporter [Devosia sp. YR412]SEQ03312.1 Threonine/homoserine efflux transporter RhtA [Devosia sp. YR412]
MTSTPQTRTDNVGRAILLTIVTVGVFGVQDAMSKTLMQNYSPFQITMMRYWGFALFSLFLVLRQAPLKQALRSKVPVWQVLRGSLLIIEIWFFALALQRVPLGELQAISLVYPLLVTLFAIPILGEKVGIFRFAAVGAGFAGALIIVRPGGLPLDWGVGFALISATLYAIYIVVTRKVSGKDSATTSMAYTGLMGLLLSSTVGVFHWQAMPWSDLLVVLAIVVTTCLGHGLMIFALSMAPASTVQPFNYFSLPWAILLSVVIFNDWIDPVSLVGAGIVVAAGLVVMARERIRKVPVPDAVMMDRE